MPAKETESVLTEDQKSTLIPHINAFRQGDRTERAQIVRKLAKPMSAADDPPLVQSKYFKAVKNWFFNRGRRPEKLELFRHRGFSAQEVYNRAFRDEITLMARAAMGGSATSASLDTLDEEANETADVEVDQDATTSMPAFVGVRQRTLSKMFSELPEAERDRYKKIAEKWSTSRAPKDMLLRRAKRYTAPYTKAFASQMYKDLGVRVVVFSMQKDEDDEIKVGFHDYNGYYDGAPSLTENRPNWQNKIHILDELDGYAEALFESDDADSSSETPPPKSKDKGRKLEYENGYPKIPDPDLMKHKHMEIALRELMTHHYHRASGTFRGSVPWGDIVPRITEFLDAEYLPEGFRMKTLDHLRVKDCAALLKHLLDRQNKHGVGTRVFSWKCFAQKQRGKGIVATPALISFDDNEEQDPTELLAHSQLRPPPRRKGKGKRKQPGEGGEDFFGDSGMETPSDVDWIDIDKNKVNKSPLDAQDSDDEDMDSPAPPPRTFTWMPATKRHANDAPSNSGEDEDDEEGNAPKRAASGRRGVNRQLVVDSDESEDADAVPEDQAAPDEPRTIKPVRGRRPEVDQADVILVPRVRKESERMRVAAQEKSVGRPAARKPAAQKPAAQKPAAKASAPKGKPKTRAG